LKPDPYATPAHKSVNAFLVVLTALLIFIVFRTSPLAHRGSPAPEAAQTPQVSK
jgi:hypothetical protein